jgi:cystathionine beta-lyase
MNNKNISFDEVVDIQGVNAIKTERLTEHFGRSDLMPLWVADMDFPTPAFIVDALRKRLDCPIFGYTLRSNGLYAAIVDWLRQRHRLAVDAQQIDIVPGVVKAIGYCINLFTQTGDKIIIQPPVYHPFKQVCEGNGRIIVNNSLKMVNQRYQMDFELLERQIDGRCKMLILSNPHNPAGVVWDVDTLRTLANICSKHNILVISDEIHADLVIDKSVHHTPFAVVADNAQQNCITLMSGSKTFNIAGLYGSYSIVYNKDILAKWRNFLSVNELSDACLFAYIALETAYRSGHQWLDEVLNYLNDNAMFVKTYLEQNIPQIKPYMPQATYLMWLDCRPLGLSHDKLIDLFVNQAHLALNDGLIFGEEGNGFMRLNFATPRKNLQTALERLQAATAKV